MADLKISVEPEKQEAPQVDIKQTLKDADEYQKLKEENDRLEAEYNRREELKAKMALGGRAQAGQVEKSEQEKADEEAAELLKRFK